MAELPGKVERPNSIISHAHALLLRVVDTNSLLYSKGLISKMRETNTEEPFTAGVRFTAQRPRVRALVVNSSLKRPSCGSNARGFPGVAGRCARQSRKPGPA